MKLNSLLQVFGTTKLIDIVLSSTVLLKLNTSDRKLLNIEILYLQFKTLLSTFSFYNLKLYDYILNKCEFDV